MRPLVTRAFTPMHRTTHLRNGTTYSSPTVPRMRMVATEHRVRTARIRKSSIMWAKSMHLRESIWLLHRAQAYVHNR